uniref:Uncharacterized protein n=1 Tax=Lactuca sativa TaxID=4236 RepID=A0A9R1V373_LACSA|nr:hypothetical protein LSAT_V11C600303950 [Lactuca sativa]
MPTSIVPFNALHCFHSYALPRSSFYSFISFFLPHKSPTSIHFSPISPRKHHPEGWSPVAGGTVMAVELPGKFPTIHHTYTYRDRETSRGRQEEARWCRHSSISPKSHTRTIKLLKALYFCVPFRELLGYMEMMKIYEDLELI